jgi:competence protein ComEA
MTARAQQPESEKGIDPFDKFFHPAGEMPVQAAAKPAATPEATPAAFEETTPSGFPAQTKLDVNTASLAELENVPGIGPSIAERITEARPFKSADDLQRVKGIGPGKRYEKIRPFFN